MRLPACCASSSNKAAGYRTHRSLKLATGVIIEGALRVSDSDTQSCRCVKALCAQRMTFSPACNRQLNQMLAQTLPQAPVQVSSPQSSSFHSRDESSALCLCCGSGLGSGALAVSAPALRRDAACTAAPASGARGDQCAGAMLAGSALSDTAAACVAPRVQTEKAPVQAGVISYILCGPPGTSVSTLAHARFL